MLGDAVRRGRHQMGLSQTDLARLAHVSRKHISSIENGANVTIDVVEKVAKALELSEIRLVGFTLTSELTEDAVERITAAASRALADIETIHALVSPLGKRRKTPSSSASAPSSSPGSERIAAVRPHSEGDFPPPPIPIDQWIERDTDRPRSLHAWLVPVAAEVAAGVPRDTDDLLIPSAQVLNTLKEVRDERRKVVKVLGDSMHPTLRNGWKVLLDPARGLFQPGKIVMVYLRDEGTTIGMLARGTREGEFKIVKRNPDYGGPIEIELPNGEWYPIGTVTTVVEAPIEVDD